MNLIRDMKRVLKEANENALTGDQNKEQALKKLNEFVELHAMVKELSVIQIERNYFLRESLKLLFFYLFVVRCSFIRTQWNHLLKLHLCQALQQFAVQC